MVALALTLEPIPTCRLHLSAHPRAHQVDGDKGDYEYSYTYTYREGKSVALLVENPPPSCGTLPSRTPRTRTLLSCGGAHAYSLATPGRLRAAAAGTWGHFGRLDHPGRIGLLAAY